MPADDFIPVNLNTLEQVTKLINSTLSLPSLLEVIMDAAKEILGTEGSSLLLLDDKKQELNFYVVAGEKKELIKEISVPIGKGIAGIVAQTETPIIVHDAENDPRIFKKVDEHANQVTKNLICVPMKVKGKLIGVLEVINSKNQDDFSVEQMNILSYLADQAAIAINNSDLFQKLSKTRFALQNRINELSILYEYSEIANSAVNVDTLFSITLKFIRKVLNIKSALVYIYYPQTKEFIPSYTIGTPKKSVQLEKLTADTLEPFLKEYSRPVLLPRATMEFVFLRKVELKFPVISLPLYTENNLFGFIFLWNKEDTEPFNSFDLRILDRLTSPLAQTYSNIKLHESLIKQDHIKQELKVAYFLQQTILPDTFKAPKEIDIHGVSIPAEEVGGDFYDFIPIDDEKFALVIADVSGKGIPASLFMALARNTIRTETHRDPNPKRVMKKVNRSLCQDSESGMFVTAAYLLVDTFNKAITYVSAGHNRQLLYQCQQQKTDIIKGLGKPLGVFPDTRFEEKVLFYEKGDLLILFTDGIIEAEKSDSEQYEEERFIDFIQKNHHLPINEFIKQAREDVNHFTEGKPFTDDFTLLVTRL